MSNPARIWNNIYLKNSECYALNGSKKRFIKRTGHPNFQKLLKYVNKDDNILEPGCGSGKFSIQHAILKHKATALDYSKFSLKKVKKLKKDAESHFGRLNVNLLRGDLEKLSIKDCSYNLVFNDGVIEHWLNKKERVKVIKEMVRVTKNNGYVIIIVPNTKHPLCWWWNLLKGSAYYSIETKYNIRALKNDLTEAGLTIVESDGLQAFFSINTYPRFNSLSKFLMRLDKNITLPKIIREKFGKSLFVCGKKIK